MAYQAFVSSCRFYRLRATGHTIPYNELILTVQMQNLPRYKEYFVLSLAVGKNDMMIQMFDKPNTTPIGQDRETLAFKALLYLAVAVHV